MKNSKIPGFKVVPKTGVIYVMTKAAEYGFDYHDPEWANLGQGSPETGLLEGSPERIENIQIEPESQSYGPVAGINELRQKVADYYNLFFRKDKKSKYTYENVCISGGGRLSLTRIAASLDSINMGHFIPDYTAYEELLSVFRGFIPIPILLPPDKNYQISAKELQNQIRGLGLRAMLISNPCNPTGQVIKDEELKKWIKTAEKTQCSIIFDEFYSHFIYNGENKIVSAAEYIEDVNKAPIIIVDGLTKNWRYPGWRISWIVAPKEVIENVASAGSFLDGGANRPLQMACLDLLEPELIKKETMAIQKHFRDKRDYMKKRLEEMGIEIEALPEGAFYFWANLQKLPTPINDSMRFFLEGLKEKVITVPGEFFDVNPGKRRGKARYTKYCRISFGPDLEKLEKGLNSLQRVINKFSR